MRTGPITQETRDWADQEIKRLEAMTPEQREEAMRNARMIQEVRADMEHWRLEGSGK